MGSVNAYVRRRSTIFARQMPLCIDLFCVCFGVCSRLSMHMRPMLSKNSNQNETDAPFCLKSRIVMEPGRELEAEHWKIATMNICPDSYVEDSSFFRSRVSCSPFEPVPPWGYLPVVVLVYWSTRYLYSYKVPGTRYNVVHSS